MDHIAQPGWRRVRMWLTLAALIMLGAGIAQASPVAPGREQPETAMLATLSQDETAQLHPALRRSLIEQARVAASACEGRQACADHAAPASQEYVKIIVEWRRVPELAPAAATSPDRVTRRQQVITALQADAEQQTSPLYAMLEAATEQGQARALRRFWISPVIALEARPDLIAQLAARDDVVQVRPDERFELDAITFEPVSAAGDADNLPWNLVMLDVDLAQLVLDVDGTGVTVANLDTGVDWLHPALLTQYRGYRGRGLAVHWGNWHVSTNETYLYPGDGYGHGTHVMGSIVGDDGAGNRIGVAPGARWIAVKLFDNAGSTYESWIHDAFQWIMAPEGDPALAPDIVNNSWGSSVGSDSRFRSAVQALRAAGILPVFSAGNQGPQAGSVGSPASYPEALAVGALDEQSIVTLFSARGPSPWGEVKPEVLAPGANVRSAFPGGGYARGNGTSMAAPHASGVAALLKQLDPDITPNQIETILTTTAQPLDHPVPNNTTGWGLINAYAAGLRLAANGELTGRVVRANWSGIAFPTVTVTPRGGDRPISVAGDGDGAFKLALQPGLYDVTAVAFGFDPAAPASVEIVADHSVHITLSLTAQPAGVIFGRVTDLDTAAPISATLTLPGVPMVTHTDPNTGLYSLALPPGAYAAAITAPGHRIGRFEVTIVAGQSQQFDVSLRPGPRILLVDSGRWYYDSQISFFEDALTALDYPYTLWPVRDPFGQSGIGPDTPSLTLLKQNDLVIWSAPHDAPGLIGAENALASYLDQGGHLLLSGQDIAFWDAGGSPMAYPTSYLAERIAIRFEEEKDQAELAGLPGTPLDGLTLRLNTMDSARQQLLPDAAMIMQPLVTQPVLAWPDGSTGGVIAGRCRPFRAAWLGFGLEGAGPRAARVEAIDRLLTHFAAPPAPYGLSTTDRADPLIGQPGAIVSHTWTLQSTGIADDLLDLRVEGGPWPITLVLPNGRRVQDSATVALPSCKSITITAEVGIPDGMPRDARSSYSLHLTSQNSPDISTAVELVAKTPAPIVLVDDERWYNHEDRFIAALEALGLAFDVLSTSGGDASPSLSTLQSYPLTVWTTGYDWYRPLTAADLAMLGTYLDGGGRLLISSQDLLDTHPDIAFLSERLGIASWSPTVEAAEVLGLPGNPVGEQLGPWRLVYPFHNWSDSLAPTAAALGLLQDQSQNTVAIMRPAAGWRTAFFAFPLETLDPEALPALMGHTLVWLSPLGESRLEAPAFAARGTQIPITLTIGLADDRPRQDLAAHLPLPPGADLVPGSVRGPWQYDAAARSLVWAGALTPGLPIVLGANLELSSQLADNTILPLQAQLYAGDGLTVTAASYVRVAAPWLTLRETAQPEEVAPGGVAEFTLDIANAGHLTASARLTNTMPSGLTILPQTAQASLGILTAGPGGLAWQADMAPATEATIRFSAQVAPSLSPPRLTDWTQLSDQTGRRVVAWATVRKPQRIFVPLILRSTTQ